MENTNEISKNKKEQIAIAIGFLLILIVILITLFRSNLFSGEDDAQNEGQIVKEDNGLEYKAITAKDLHKKILLAEENEQPVLLDIRPFQTYADEHIADAINITPEEFPLEQKIDLHKSIIVIGENPEDENIKKTITQLEKEDFKNFMVLAGGMEAWKQLVGVTVNYGNPNSFEDQMKVSYVEGKDLNDALKQNVPTFILDVRTAEEYAKGHIPGAINIPAEELEKRRKEITEKRVVVVGINELQEFQSSVQIYDMLLVSPFVLNGAMPEWEKNGYLIQK
ncbi:MAG TPA: rhodanese-like domain-containing protein [Candidatus Moranbacteria bacterium]|nr:rhodanese-like domain-containing protein [Candidatus Moranbacteria bacterium]HSA08158.1 rhodanese-like domain-containing protein [Candidatus Moranbacteria bacterium]